MKFLGEAFKINRVTCFDFIDANIIYFFFFIKTLVELELSKNKIAIDGTIKLADGLKTNKVTSIICSSLETEFISICIGTDYIGSL